MPDMMSHTVLNDSDVEEVALSGNRSESPGNNKK